MSEPAPAQSESAPAQSEPAPAQSEPAPAQSEPAPASVRLSQVPEGSFAAAALTADDADRLASRFRASWDDAEWSEPGTPPPTTNDVAPKPRVAPASLAVAEPAPPAGVTPKPEARSTRARVDSEDIHLPKKSNRGPLLTIGAVVAGLSLIVGAFIMRGAPETEALERHPTPPAGPPVEAPAAPPAEAPEPSTPPLEATPVAATPLEATPVEATPTPAEVAPPLPVEPPPPQPIRIQLELSPRSATVLANGAPLATPNTLSGLPGTAVRIVVSAEGYVTDTRSVILAEDGRLAIDLDRVPEPPPPVVARPPVQRPHTPPAMQNPPRGETTMRPSGGFVTENPY